MRDNSSPIATAAAPRPTRAQIRWWASTFALQLATFVAGLSAFLSQAPPAVWLGCFGVTAVVGRGRIRARDEFRRGWRDGYGSALRDVGESAGAPLAPGASRAAPPVVPEPWDDRPLATTPGRRP